MAVESHVTMNAGFFGEGLAPVEIDSRYGYLDKEGRIAIEPQFDYAYPLTEGLACIKNVVAVGTR